MEHARTTGRQPSVKRELQEIPEFRSHLRRNGITFDDFKRQQQAQEGDVVSAELQLRHKKASTNQHRSTRK